MSLKKKRKQIDEIDKIQLNINKLPLTAYQLHGFLYVLIYILNTPSDSPYIGIIKSDSPFFILLKQILNKNKHPSYMLCYQLNEDPELLSISRRTTIRKRDFWYNVVKLYDWLINDVNPHGMLKMYLSIYNDYTAGFFMKHKRSGEEYLCFPKRTKENAIITFTKKNLSGQKQFKSDLVKIFFLFFIAKLRIAKLRIILYIQIT